MKKLDIIAIVLVLSCTCLALLQGFIFYDKLNCDFPTAKVTRQIIYYCLLYIAPRIWFSVVYNISKNSGFQPYTRILKIFAAVFVCLLLAIKNYNLTINIVQLSSNKDEATSRLIEFYHIDPKEESHE